MRSAVRSYCPFWEATLSVIRDPKSWWIRKAIGYALRKADLVCVASRFLLDEISTYRDIPTEVAHIPHGVDCEVFSPIGNSVESQPNKYPFDKRDSENTSLADFYMYGKK